MFREPQVNIYVANVAASVRFYCDLFGFRETFRTPAEGVPDHAEVRLEGLCLGFASFAAAQAHHALTANAGPTRAELVLWHDDVDAAYAEAVAAGGWRATAYPTARLPRRPPPRRLDPRPRRWSYTDRHLDPGELIRH